MLFLEEACDRLDMSRLLHSELRSASGRIEWRGRYSSDRRARRTGTHRLQATRREARLFLSPDHPEITPCHFFRLRYLHRAKQGGRDISECAAAPQLVRNVVSNQDKRHGI